MREALVGVESLSMEVTRRASRVYKTAKIQVDKSEVINAQVGKSLRDEIIRKLKKNLLALRECDAC